MFVLRADKNKLAVRQLELVTSGSVNVYTVRFEFSEDWAGMTRTAVFRAGGEARCVLLDEANTCAIPWEVLGEPNLFLFAGVYGARDGAVVLPTVWASLGAILCGVTTGESAQPPTPDLWAQELGGKGDRLDWDGQNLALMSGDKPLSRVGIALGNNDGIPSGIIVMWSGRVEDIPAGWALCDGEEGRPDLRDRFVLGAGGKYPVGQTGGEEHVTLTKAQIPKHGHGEYIDIGGGIKAPLVSKGSTRDTMVSGRYLPSGTAFSYTYWLESELVGGGEGHPNMPPYYALCYIMKVESDEKESAP